jgi:hypothetical protein
MLPFQVIESYSDRDQHIRWQGNVVQDARAFDSYLRERVAPRLFNHEATDELLKLASTVPLSGMGQEILKKHLAEHCAAVEESCKAWQVGEALAESLLEDSQNIHWPWNSEADKRTPKASLPGADLVGFANDATGPIFFFGEVKTSKSADSPPAVVEGRSGMKYQLHGLANSTNLRQQLILYILPRCEESPSAELFRSAICRYYGSAGRDYRLCGMLMRDTEPNTRDLESTCACLVTGTRGCDHVDMAAWYLPRPVAEWPDIASGGVQ